MDITEHNRWEEDTPLLVLDVSYAFYTHTRSDSDPDGWQKLNSQAPVRVRLRAIHLCESA
jgi:hypothetical protein